MPHDTKPEGYEGKAATIWSGHPDVVFGTPVIISDTKYDNGIGYAHVEADGKEAWVKIHHLDIGK